MAEDPEQAGGDPSHETVEGESPGGDIDEQAAGTGESAPDAMDDGGDPQGSGEGSIPDDDTDNSDEESDVTEPADEPDPADAADVTEPADASGATEPADAAERAGPVDATAGPVDGVPSDVRKYERFKKMDGAQYERVNDFLRDRTYVTAREWAIARLCADFRTETGVEMTKIGENLPELVPFMTDSYTPQAVNQARSSFEEKIRKSGATFLYGAMCGFFTAEELDEMMYDVTEIAKFLLEVEGVDLSVEDELEAEERISSVMREVREASDEFRSHDVDTNEED